MNHRARAELARRLERDAKLQEVAPEEMGRDFDAFDAKTPRDDPDVALALAFWDAWIDARNHQFPGFYQGITAAAWPDLARRVACALLSGSRIDEPLIRAHFSFARESERPPTR